jgi:hypothetical protein
MVLIAIWLLLGFCVVPLFFVSLGAKRARVERPVKDT